MTTVEHTISEPVFVHARIAADLTHKINDMSSSIKIIKGSSTAEATSLLGVLGLAIKSGDEISFKLTGDNEEMDARELTKFLKENL